MQNKRKSWIFYRREHEKEFQFIVEQSRSTLRTSILIRQYSARDVSQNFERRRSVRKCKFQGILEKEKCDLRTVTMKDPISVSHSYRQATEESF